VVGVALVEVKEHGVAVVESVARLSVGVAAEVGNVLSLKGASGRCSVEQHEDQVLDVGAAVVVRIHEVAGYQTLRHFEARLELVDERPLDLVLLNVAFVPFDLRGGIRERLGV
jgi:hypothetical protein